MRTFYIQYRREELNDALISAIQRNDASAVSILLAGGVDANARDHERQPISLIDFCKQIVGLRQLTPNSGRTPLMDASYGRNVVIVKMLLDAGARVNATDRDGNTPLLYATYNHTGHPGPTILILAEHGAGVDTTTKSGREAWLIARGNSELWEALHKAAAFQHVMDGE
jgi:ankyrin repeat protein